MIFFTHSLTHSLNPNAINVVLSLPSLSLSPASSDSDTDDAKSRETAISTLASRYVSAQSASSIKELLHDLRPSFTNTSTTTTVFPKAKTAKIVRQLLDAVAQIPNTTLLQLELCLEQSKWAASERRTFLRQRIDTRLVQLYLDTKQFSTALKLISSLSAEVKRIDDKVLLVDIHLLESRIHYALKNLAKAKASLTAARTAANSIYVPPSTQAQIDTQAGV